MKLRSLIKPKPEALVPQEYLDKPPDSLPRENGNGRKGSVPKMRPWTELRYFFLVVETAKSHVLKAKTMVDAA
jgi:hypothetical protein